MLIQFDITTYVETGIHVAESLSIVDGWFSAMDEKYEKGEKSNYKLFAVDNKKEYCNDAMKRFIHHKKNIQIACESSEKFLKKFVEKYITSKEQMLFYLDAHWQKYWPLRDEISEILKLKNKPIIAIDDFKNAHFLNVGEYDTYDGHECGTEYIRDLIKGRSNFVCVFNEGHYFQDRITRRTNGLVFIDRTMDDVLEKAGHIPLLFEKV